MSLYFCALTQQCITDDYGVPQANQFGVPTLYKVDEQGNFIIDRRGNPIPVPDGQVVFPPLPDPVAAVYALNGSLGTQQQALVKIVAGDVPQYVRGQSVVGLSFAEQLSMNASDQEFNGLIDLLFSDQLTFLEFFGTLYLIVAREPQNATLVSDVAARLMINRFLRYVANNDGESDRASIDVVGDPAPTGSEQLLLPMLSDN